jgi:histidinol-phosphate aminotransferase
LLRDDLRGFTGYASARSQAVAGTTWLNANESPQANAADPDGLLRRYPDPQPAALVGALAALYGVEPADVLACRGSDEGIDLLVRAFCTPGRDAIAIAPPVFGMYAVSARLHGATVVEVPATDAESLAVDLGALAAAVRAQPVRVVFLCSPGNPTGACLEPAAVLAFATALRDRALVVVDEAYLEFGDAPSLAPAVATCPNLVVLRTLSKAHALAGARIGCVIADRRVVAALARCQAPYPIAAPSAAAALAALDPEALARTRAGIATLCSERERLRAALAAVDGVRRVHASGANFLLVRFADPAAVYARLLAAGIVVRDVRGQPMLDDALRITVGAAADNDRLLQALGTEPAP